MIKLQDILFIFALLFLLYKKEPNWIIAAGLICIIASIPLFAFWVFFTAERLIYYAFFFLLAGSLLFFRKKR